MQDWVLKVAVFSASTPLSMALLRSLSRLSAGHGVCHQRQLHTVGKHQVSHLRKEYSKQGLFECESMAQEGPIALFRQWLQEAVQAKVLEPNAMCLSTCSLDMKPSARYVLLKDFDDRGFVWFTNYESRKGTQLSANPHAALTFWWGDLERQVRVEGSVERVSAEESETYFHSRPRGSQLGAWSSRQSQPIDSRHALEEQERDVIARYHNETVVPRPEHWGGFRLIPQRIEFWKGRESRLHDRLVFERLSPTSQWTLVRLQP